MKNLPPTLRILSLFVLFVAAAVRIQAATHQVIVQNDRFTPATLTIAVGDTVTWVFRESSHDTVNKAGSTYGNIWNSGLKPVNSTFNFTFNNAGTFPYVCRPHEFNRNMVGTITVQGAANTPPTISLTGPTAGATFLTTDTITFSANAADADGSVSKVEFFRAGSTLIGAADTSAPYSVTASLPAGTHSITARVTDNLGATTTTTAINITVNAPNQAPTVSVTSPANAATFTTTDTITFSANAADADGSVSKVEFFREGTTLIGAADTSAPYSVTATLPAGTHTITAKATDNSGAATTSIGVTITVNAPNSAPVVTLTSPQAGKVIASPGSVTLTATATDDSTITQIEFFRGGTSISVDTTSPYEATVSNLTPGVYTFTATARDDSSATGTSTSIEVRVAAAPQITSIARNIAANTTTITATATDAIPHALEVTSDFSNWTTVGQPATPIGGGTVTFNDSTTDMIRFYRVVAR